VSPGKVARIHSFLYIEVRNDYRCGLRVSPHSEPHVSRRLKLFVGVSGVLLVTFVALGFFVWYQLTKSFPQTTGSTALQSITQQTDVYRDPYGVPRIVALNDRDALVAMGFVHAQDRLWQMDLQRRAASGRLSEVFGRATLPFDRMFRIIGLRRIAEKIDQQLPEDTRADLQAYCDGVNAFRTVTRGRLPIEFDLLRYEPELWTTVDCILIGRLIAWELNLSWWTDITYGSLVARLGRDTVAQILPSYPSTIPPQVPAEEWRRYADNLRGYAATSQDYLAHFGRPMVSGGSNAWAIASNKSATGAVILANDTHLHLTQPSQWYEVGIIAPGLTVHGMSIPGVPGVVAGKNDSIAWGVTNLMADDADFYFERINEPESTYFYDNAWRKLTIVDEEIPVRGDTTEILHVRATGHGPIVTDIRTPLNQAQPPFVASMRWVGAEIDDQAGAFLKINRAHNWNEFTQGLRAFSLPGQNFVYGDARGNIGYYCAARLPIRGSKQGLLPVPGWERSNDWTGFVPFDQLPHILNPSTGFVASANNKTVDDSYPYYIGQLWEPPSRIQRLQDVLGNTADRISIQDCKQLQTETYSHLARELTPYVLAAASDSVIGTEYGERVREYLRNWDFRFTTDNIATSIYQEFLVHLIRNIFSDEMGDELFHDFTMLVNVPLRVTTRLLKEGSSVWFDDVRTPVVETREDILRRSARDAVHDLISRVGEDPRLWRWGSLHTVTLQHPFGLQPPLGKIFNVGPFPYPGASSALMSGEYSLTAPFAVSVAASYRQIFSFADPETHLAVLPSGESGQVYQQHYDDQTPLWLYGAYRTVTRSPVLDSWDHLRLLPGGAGE
jgi:penicillin G amidase